MKRHANNRLLLTLIVALLWTGKAHAQTPNVIAAYTNQRGSTLYIENVASNGLVTGYYINRAQGYQCQGTAYPVAGWLLGNVLTFTVQWDNSAENCNSLTAWAGYFSSNWNTLTTSWLLVVSGSTTITPGQDVFTRTAERRSPALIPPGRPQE